MTKRCWLDDDDRETSAVLVPHRHWPSVVCLIKAVLKNINCDVTLKYFCYLSARNLGLYRKNFKLRWGFYWTMMQSDVTTSSSIFCLLDKNHRKKSLVSRIYSTQQRILVKRVKFKFFIHFFCAALAINCSVAEVRGTKITSQFFVGVFFITVNFKNV